MYRYFIAFDLLPSGKGNTEVNLTKKIENVSDVQAVARAIEQNQRFPSGSVSITNFQLFDGT